MTTVEPRCTKKPADPTEVGGAMTALIVEGVPGLRRVLGGLLRDRGMEVSTAGSVAAARGQIGHRPFDAVIVDLVLPDGSGLDVLDTLRGSGSRAHVIVMSDSTADADRIAALAVVPTSTW